YTDAYVASFVGFAPAAQARVVIAVMIDDPRGGRYYGGDVAAPVFSQVAAGTLRALQVAPQALALAAGETATSTRWRAAAMNGADAVRPAGPIVDWIRAHAPQAVHLRIDSRQIERGDVFLALPGRRDDGRLHVAEAVARGAAAVVTEPAGAGAPACAVPILAVEGLAARLGDIGAAFYRDPTARLLMIGVTGTHGKTSCSHCIAQVLTACGRRCAVIGTVGSGFTDALQTDSTLTTPDAIGLQRQARALLDSGAQALAMEVSSIGLDQGRTDSIQFDLALFTNLTRDHLDYHGTMAEYERAKARLFDVPSLAHAVLNLDDAFGRRLAERCRAR